MDNSQWSHNNPYFDTYNSGRRNRPNFSWSNQGYIRPLIHAYQAPAPLQEKKANWKIALEKLAQQSEKFAEELATIRKEQEASF